MVTDETLENLSVMSESTPAAENVAEPDTTESAGPTTQPSDVTPHEPEPQKTVPLAALHEERARRKELEAAQREQAERFAKLESRFERLQEIRDAEPEVSYEENPGEYLKRRVENQDKELEGYRQWKQQSEQQARMAQFEQAVASKEYEFTQSQPDYAEAAAFLRESRMKEYIAAGYSAEQAAMSIQQERLALSHNAMMQERNPGEVFYALAKGRGYGQKAAPAPNPDLEALGKKIEKTSGLGPSGSTGTGELTLEQLKTMSDEEFDAATNGKRWSQLWQ